MGTNEQNKARALNLTGDTVYQIFSEERDKVIIDMVTSYKSGDTNFFGHVSRLALLFDMEMDLKRQHNKGNKELEKLIKEG